MKSPLTLAHEAIDRLAEQQAMPDEGAVKEAHAALDAAIADTKERCVKIARRYMNKAVDIAMKGAPDAD